MSYLISFNVRLTLFNFLKFMLLNSKRENFINSSINEQSGVYISLLQIEKLNSAQRYVKVSKLSEIFPFAYFAWDLKYAFRRFL